MSGKSGMSGRPPTTARHINAFSCPTWLSLCRAHVGRARLHGAPCGTDGRAWAGCGPWEAWGDARRTGRPFLGGWPFRAPRPACGLHTGQVRRLGCAGASILKRHVFAVARHHVGQVGQAANNSKAYQRFFLPDMAFPMSGACRACRARPTSWGTMRDGWKGMGRMRPVGGMGRRAPHRTAFPLAAGLSGRPRPACGLHAG